jgi:MFS family permease
MSAAGPRADRRRVNRLTPLGFVVGFGVVSMLADVVYEGARSVTGPFLASLGASAALVGLATGAGEAVALVARIATGRLVDRTGRPWVLTVAGYLVTVVSVPLLALAGHVWSAVTLVVAERFGKALRAPARDTMLAHAGSSAGRGRAFAVHEALDQLGAFAGPLLVAGALALGWGFHGSFAVLAVPGVLAVAVLLSLRRLVPRPSEYDAEPDRSHELHLRDGRLPALFWRYAVFSTLTMLGFATFGVLSFHVEARHVLPTAVVPLVYAVAMAVDAVAALVSGHVYDRVGLRGLVVLPVLAAVVPWLSFSSSAAGVWVGAAVWGAALGVQESTMRAAVADLVPPARRGTAYGVFSACYGLAWLVGGAGIGWLYERGTTSVGLAVLVVQVLALSWFVLRVRSSGSPHGR